MTRLFVLLLAAALQTAGAPGGACGQTVRGFLVPPDGAGGDAFGEAVAVTENFVVVGAPFRASGGAPDGGAIYVFRREDLAFVRRIDSPLTGGRDNFGAQIAAAGADRFATGGTPRTRRAFLYDAATGALIRELVQPGETDQFDGALAGSDTVVAVANLFQDHPGADGTVSLFDAASGLHLRDIANPASRTDNFSIGNSLALSADTLFAGAIYGRPLVPGTGSGQAYAIRLDDGALVDEWSDPTQGQNLLGAAVAPRESRLVAVSPGYDDGLPYGYLYVFERGSAGAVLVARSPGLASPERRNDRFGRALVWYGADLLVSAPSDSRTSQAGGAVFRVSGATGAVTPFLDPPGPVTSGLLGEAMALDASAPGGGGGGTLYVGEPGSPFSPTFAGRVVVVSLPAAVEGATGWQFY